MSRKKKKDKVSLLKNKMYLLVCMFSTLVVVLLIVLGFYIFNNKDYYKVESRVDSIRSDRKLANTNYTEIGWLRIQGTDIDYPVVYGESYNEPFPMEEGNFVWTENGDKKFHNMIRIVGHNLYNLGPEPKIESKYFYRFEQLMAFVYEDFAKENKYVQYTIDGKDYVYKIFAVGFIGNTEKYNISLNDDYSKKELKQQIKDYKDNSLYDYNVDVKETDKLISLSTCTRFFSNSDYEFFVAGRLVRDGEKINNYNVIKNNNYKKVEKVLKGDEKDGKDAL